MYFSILQSKHRSLIVWTGAIFIVAIATLGASISWAASTATVAATVTANNLAVSVSDGSIAFGSIALNTSSTTVGHGETQTVSNDGSAAVINVKSSDATGGTGWTLGTSPGSDVFELEVSTTTGSTYMPFQATNTYLTASSSAASLTSGPVDFRITTPTASTDFVQKSITITLQVTSP